MVLPLLIFYQLWKLPHCWRAFDPPKRRKAGELLPSSLQLLFSTPGAGRLLSHLYLSRQSGLPSCMNVTNVPENKTKTKKKNWFVCLFFTFFFFFRFFLRGKIQFICLLINTSELLIGSRQFDYDGANCRYPSPSKFPNENNIT